MDQQSGDKPRLAMVQTAAQMEEALCIRRAVFIGEQGVLEEEEIDAYDADPTEVTDAIHVIAYLDGGPVATGRLLLDASSGEGVHIGRIAVLRAHRRRGLGRAVMLALQDEAKKRGYRAVEVAAQLEAMPFYQSLGYAAYGEMFLDARIEHRMMRLLL